MDVALQVFVDKMAIREVLIRWNRGLDRADHALMTSAYHPDAIDEHGPYHYTGETAAAGYISRHTVKERKRHMHTLVGETIEVSGDRAACESYFIAYLITDDPEIPGEEAILVFGGRYVDRFERRHGEWRISRRKMIIEWNTKAKSYPIEGSFVGLAAADRYEGRRSFEDPSYAWFDLTT